MESFTNIINLGSGLIDLLKAIVLRIILNL